MERFPVDPADCLIVLAIHGTGSLREAARSLDCDPGGLLRKVQRIADDHALLQKVNGKWAATERGLAAMAWAQESIQQQKRHLMSERTVRIAATTWFAEGVLIPQSTKAAKYLGPGKLQFSVPANGFEKALIAGDCDFVVVCHPPENPVIAHRQLGAEPWSVIVAPGLLPVARPNRLEQLFDAPYVRHSDLNPEALIPKGSPALKYAPVQVDNLIGVRSAVVNKLGWSIVPTALVIDDLRLGRLHAIDPDVEMSRKVCVWWLRSSARRKSTADLCEWVEAACTEIGRYKR